MTREGVGGRRKKYVRRSAIRKREGVIPIANWMTEHMPDHLVMNLNMLSGLKAEQKIKFRGLLLCWAYEGYNRVCVIEGLRSLDRQKRLYGQGRSELECKLAGVPAEYATPAKPQVTWSAPEDSMHVHGLACDIDLSAYVKKDWEKMAAIARALGFVWGGDWQVRDYRHFQIGG